MNFHEQFLDDFSDIGIVPIEHYVIDFRAILLNAKLMKLKGKAEHEPHFTEYDFAQLI